MASPLSCKCPACGNASLFTGVLSVVDACPSCGVSLKDHDSGDGPVFFAILIVGFLVTFSAGFVEYSFSPPFWLHAILWIPLTFAACFYVLRVSKSYLIHYEYRLREKDAIR
ncbi:MAG: DUF983 domain-containing protein [Alphaproteobacteria bacterium]|nr:DUF983 domain-containing protein [Alphaproteobacteria bacterium]